MTCLQKWLSNLDYCNDLLSRYSAELGVNLVPFLRTFGTYVYAVRGRLIWAIALHEGQLHYTRGKLGQRIGKLHAGGL